MSAITKDFRFGGFTASDAARVSGRLVTITTHGDIEHDRPGETLGPLHAIYVPGKRYLMLAESPAASEAPDHLVYLVDVASVTITEESDD